MTKYKVQLPPNHTGINKLVTVIEAENETALIDMLTEAYDCVQGDLIFETYTEDSALTF